MKKSTFERAIKRLGAYTEEKDNGVTLICSDEEGMIATFYEDDNEYMGVMGENLGLFKGQAKLMNVVSSYILTPKERR